MCPGRFYKTSFEFHRSFAIFLLPKIWLDWYRPGKAELPQTQVLKCYIHFFAPVFYCVLYGRQDCLNFHQDASSLRLLSGIWDLPFFSSMDSDAFLIYSKILKWYAFVLMVNWCQVENEGTLWQSAIRIIRISNLAAENVFNQYIIDIVHFWFAHYAPHALFVVPQHNWLNKPKKWFHLWSTDLSFCRQVTGFLDKFNKNWLALLFTFVGSVQ